MIFAAAIVSRTGLREEDQKLIARICDGHLEGFAELYRRHADKIYALLTRLVGPVSEREDLVQEVFVEAYRALPSFRGESAFATFLYRIAIRVGYDALRGRKRSPCLPVDERVLEELASLDASPLDQADSRRELVRAFRLLESLSAKSRAAFVLVAIEGLSVREAGELLGANEQAVKQRVIAARKELLQRMSKEQEGGHHG
jgi:RNA polymerase sigma-70 factor (ECF subfamily)